MTLAFDEMYNSLNSIEIGGIVIFNASAFNPTGLSPSFEQWRQLAKLIKHKRLVSIFDCSGQGLVSGDLENDILSIKAFVEEAVQIIVVQDLGKTLGMYGETVGALHVVCQSKEIKNKVVDQLK